MSNKRKVYCLIAVVLAAGGLVAAGLVFSYYRPLTTTDAVDLLVASCEADTSYSKQYAQEHGCETYNEYHLHSTGEMTYDLGCPELSYKVLVLTRRTQDNVVVDRRIVNEDEFGYVLTYARWRWDCKFMGGSYWTDPITSEMK